MIARFRIAAAIFVLLCAADASALRFLRRIPVGGWPRALAISPDGEKAYVALLLDEAIAVLSREELTVERRFAVGGRPEGVALSPDGKHLYVSLGDKSRVEARTAADGQLVASIAVPPRPRGLALDPSGRYLYVACARASALSIVDLSERRVVANLEVGWSPRAVAYAPKTGRVLVVHSVGHSLYVVDPSKPAVLTRIKGFGRRPLDLAVTADGQTAFVPSSKKDRVFRVDLAAGRIVSAHEVGDEPSAVALSKNERLLYVGLWDDKKIAVMPTRKLRGRPRTVKTGDAPIALRTSPSGKTLWVACFKSHDVWVYKTP